MTTPEHVYKSDFEYTHQNPYHQRLKQFDHFVLRDREAEKYSGQWNSKVFQRDASLVAEIGSGYGQFMREYCLQNPETNYVAMDFRFKRSFELARKLNNLKLENIRYLRARGERLGHIFRPNELDTLFFFFPDPWPKARHHKNRLFQRPFLESCFKSLKPGGEFFIKTDHIDYFHWMLREIESFGEFEIELQSRDLYREYPLHFLTGFKTKFEKIFIRQGIPVKGLVLRKPAH